jgi:hypothetical protein
MTRPKVIEGNGGISPGGGSSNVEGWGGLTGDSGSAG